MNYRAGGQNSKLVFKSYLFQPLIMIIGIKLLQTFKRMETIVNSLSIFS